MSAFRIAIIATAALAAILLAFMVRGMLTPKKPPPPSVLAVAPPKPMAQVLTAKRDLPVGTRISSVDLTWQPWPVEALNPSFVTNGAQPVAAPQTGAQKVALRAAQATHDLVVQGPMQVFDGAIVKEAILQGEPVTARKVVRGGQGGYMSVVLQPGFRAMAAPINAETGAGGFILPGDRVDVLQSRPAPDGKTFISETLLRNIRVLAIDQKTEPGKDAKAIVGAVAVLEVPAEDATILARGKSQGELHLALRSYADGHGGASRGAPQHGAGVRLFKAGQLSEVVGR